ncbi:MAG: ArsR family transcriptional regulator [Flavobacteriales bacterium CG_4_9_14_0_2_um_filter_32_27]|nr:MAG: ArsR family transcriptional regulator [Flavobacteriales bacterium CG_4_9_14_0_2_um_filter_32_27]
MNKQLTPSDIESIVPSGEGYNAEFKIRVPNKLKELTEEVCAFANAAGGVLLIGVSDNNVIQGVEIDNAKRSAIQNSLNEINPHLPTEFYPVNVEGKTVWVIEVNTGTQKPYVLSGAIYVRQGSNTQKLTSVEQMRDFFQQSQRIYFDEAPCTNFNIKQDIDDEFFEEFRIDAQLSKTVNRKQIINNLRLLLPDGNMKNGGVLFFAKAPETFIDTAEIRCVAFEGINKTQIIDDKIFGGPLLKQYQQTMQWLKGKLNVRYKIEGSGPRKEIWEIPETAFKEAIINALSHRDYYDKGARTTIELFNNRVEISNPGGLTSAIKPAEFGTKSHSRNPLVFGLFERVDMVEKIGSGISRINDAMKDAKLAKPVFITEGIFTVVFNRVTVEETVEKTTMEKIIELIRNNSTITTKDIADSIGITAKGVEYQLAKMQEDKILIREGSKKSGNWKLL